MFEKGKQYKHISCRDVSIWVTNCIEQENNYLVKFQWIHDFYKFAISEDEAVIKKEDFVKWKEIKDDKESI